MRTVRNVIAITVLLFLVAEISLAKNEVQQGASNDAQPKAKTGGQPKAKTGGQPKAKTGVQPKAKTDGQLKAKKGAHPKTADGLLPKQYVIKNIRAEVRSNQDTPTVRDICSGFRFNEREVREYFKKAYVISDHVRQYGFQTLPCYVKGEMDLNGETALWEIEASAVGKIQFKNGKVVTVGCKEACRKMFDSK